MHFEMSCILSRFHVSVWTIPTNIEIIIVNSIMHIESKLKLESWFASRPGTFVPEFFFETSFMHSTVMIQINLKKSCEFTLTRRNKWWLAYLGISNIIAVTITARIISIVVVGYQVLSQFFIVDLGIKITSWFSAINFVFGINSSPINSTFVKNLSIFFLHSKTFNLLQEFLGNIDTFPFVFTFIFLQTALNIRFVKVCRWQLR